MLNKINGQGYMTHMPFLTPLPGGGRVLFFCRAGLPAAPGAAHAGEDRVWKLHYAVDDGEPVRIETGLPDEVIECAPTAWQDETGWHLSFVSGGAKANPLYYLYRMDGPALDRLSPPVALQQARSGFIHRHRLVWGEVQDIIHVREPAGDQEIELPGAYIYRVSYRADAPERILVSGNWIKDDEVFVIEYDLASAEQRFIECDGNPAYKCAILGGEIVYAERIGKEFESRKLRQARDTIFKPSRAAVRRLMQPGSPPVPVTQPCGCKGNAPAPKAEPARPSCLECVEKHLGAAYVLLAETSDGYAHRLRAVGHLHEAEDESREWPRLHRAVRQARKDYQTEGAFPDWAALEELIAEVRHAE